MCLQYNWTYETYGAVNKAGTSWLKSVCNELSDEPANVLEHMLNVVSATLQMGNGQVDVSMTLHRSGNQAGQQSQTACYHNQTMALLQQYVCGGVRLNWLAQQRQRPVRGSMREVVIDQD